MKPILTLAKKELRALLYSPTGYVFSGLMAGLAIWLFTNDLFVMGQADISPLVASMAFLLTLFVPAVGMGIIADERKSGTWESLMTWPITEGQIVVGKFLGQAGYLILSLGLLIPVMVSLTWLGYGETGLLVSSFLMLGVLAMCFLGVTMVASALSGQPIVALGGSVVFLLINSLMGNGTLVARFGPEIQAIATKLSLSWRTQRLGAGLIELDNIWFLISFIGACLVVSTLIVKSRSK